MNDQERHAIVRPTEAQLRWAQFRHKRQAARVKHAVERLWLTPASVSDVDGARSDDGNTTEESSCSDMDDSAVRRRAKPHISRGRRALLRVSKRAFEQRRQEIAKYGFLCGDGGENSSDSDEDDGLAAIFAEESFLKKRKKRHARRMALDDEERVKRFEDAFHAMMMTLAAAQSQSPEDQIVATKIWTRPDVPVSSSIDYASLKWGILPRGEQSSLRNPNVAALVSTPMDRAASWLVHLPPKSMTRPQDMHHHARAHMEDEPDVDYTTQVGPPSPVRKKFSDLVEMLQQRVSQSEDTNDDDKSVVLPTMRLKKYFSPAILDEVREEKKDDPSSIGAASEETPRSGRRLEGAFDSVSGANRKVGRFVRDLSESDNLDLNIDFILEELNSDLINELERHEPGIWKQLLMRYLEETTFDSEMNKIETISRHLESFAMRYLAGLKHSAAQKDGHQVAENDKSQCLVKRFVAQMELAAEKESLIMADGQLHRPTFARLVTQYLLQANGGSRLSMSGAAASLRRGDGRIAKRYLDTAQHHFSTLEDARRQLPTAVTDSSAGIIENFITSMEEAAEREPFVDSAGKLNGGIFEKLVAQYLAEAIGVDEDEVYTAADLHSLIERLGIADEEGQLEMATLAKRNRERASFIKYLVSHFEQAAGDELIVKPDGVLDEAVFEKLMMRCIEQSAPTQNCDVSTDEGSTVAYHQNAKKLSSPVDPDALGLISPVQAQHFINRMMEAYEREPFVNSDLELETAVFERLVSRSLDDAVCAAERKRPIDDESEELVRTFAVHFKELSEACAFVKSDGTLDRTVLRAMTISSLDQAVKDKATRTSNPRRMIAVNHSGKTSASSSLPKRFVDRFVEIFEKEISNTSASVESGQIHFELLSRLCAEKVMTEDSENSELSQPGRASASEHCDSVRNGESSFSATLSHMNGALPSPCESDIFAQMRQSTHKLQDVNFESAIGDRATNVDEAGGPNNGGRGIEGNIDGDACGMTMEGDLAGPNSHVVGSPVHMLHRKSGAEQEELEAVAAFRKAQDERRMTDDTSSLSSIRLLPEGIKRVVQGIRGRIQEDTQLNSSLNSIDDELDLGDYTVFDSEDALSADSSYFPLSGSDLDPGFSPDRARSFHQKVMAKSALMGDMNRSIIDTDGSDTSGNGVDPGVLSNLLLSPTILTKRHQQAIRAVESRSWEQVAYLLSANPWLAEMTDLATGQYLLHKLALYGAGQDIVDADIGNVISSQHRDAPEQLNTDLIRMFPASVHKFDQDGNLPLHMAAASANLAMISLLGDRFPGGASVRNEDGMLPLHLVILACASRQTFLNENDNNLEMHIVQKVLEYFRGAAAVVDNDGNLPIHTAASVLKGESGARVVHLLLDEADRQLKNPVGARFRNKTEVKLEESDISIKTEAATSPTDPLIDFEDPVHCYEVRNELGETPLMTAIHSRAGWEVIEALARGPGGSQAVLLQDSELNNALHLLVSARYKDPAAILSVLKIAPEAACIRNEAGVLPIEIACMQSLPREIILGLVLVDLPVDVDETGRIKRRDGFGASWFYLTCECDDHYVDIVDEVLSLCSYPQARELCFLSTESGETLVSRASPKCRAVLQRSLRFVGRFEFLGSIDSAANRASDVKAFDAIDYGTRVSPIPSGRRVVLKCYAREEIYASETSLLRDLDSSFTEEVLMFAVGEDGMPAVEGAKQYCICIERPNLTLRDVVAGMLKNKDCQLDLAVRQRYAEKVFSVLRIIAKALRYLHSVEIVHGDLCLDNCGKYGNEWKVAGILGLQRMGLTFDTSRFANSAPPESIEPLRGSRLDQQVSFRGDLQAHPSLDTWGFGKLAYELLVGEPLISFDENLHTTQDNQAMVNIMNWNEANLYDAREKLKAAGVLDPGVDLIIHCLAAHPEMRPTMDEILMHPVWKQVRRQTAK